MGYRISPTNMNIRHKHNKLSVPDSPSKSHSCLNALALCDVGGLEGDEALVTYTVKESKILGRHLVAKRRIQAGEVIIQDLPIVVGPTTDADYTCIGCYRLLTRNSIYKCEGCQWTLCGPDCRGINTKTGHSVMECCFLRKTPSGVLLQQAPKHERKYFYDALLPLRCLLLRDSDQDKWTKLMDMEHHTVTRRDNAFIWTETKNNIVKRIRNLWNIKMFKKSEIHRICGVLDINSFEIGHNGCTGRAVYWNPTFIAHDCQPNLIFFDDPLNYRISVKARVGIKRGEALTLSYVNLLEGTLKRRDRLNRGKYFWCQCERCLDPTELQTFLSAVKCSMCENGTILSSDPIDQDSVWNCSFCGYLLNGKDMAILMTHVTKELEDIDSNNVEGLNEFLNKYQVWLHGKHYLCLSAKVLLCQIYGEREGYMFKDLKLNDLRKLKHFCKELLEVVDKLDLGQSFLKCTITQKLQSLKRYRNKQKEIAKLEKKLRELDFD